MNLNIPPKGVEAPITFFEGAALLSTFANLIKMKIASSLLCDMQGTS